LMARKRVAEILLLLPCSVMLTHPALLHHLPLLPEMAKCGVTHPSGYAVARR